jgi:rhodanese-related sulfurtransferase
VPLGFLKFHADPTSPSRKAELGGGRKLVLYCRSGSRSALGAKSLEEIGIENVAHVASGFDALQQAGTPIQNGEAS